MEEGVEHANNTREHCSGKRSSWNARWPRSRPRPNEDMFDAHKPGMVVEERSCAFFYNEIFVGSTASGLNARHSQLYDGFLSTATNAAKQQHDNIHRPKGLFGNANRNNCCAYASTRAPEGIPLHSKNAEAVVSPDKQFLECLVSFHEKQHGYD